MSDEFKEDVEKVEEKAKAVEQEVKHFVLDHRILAFIVALLSIGLAYASVKYFSPEGPNPFGAEFRISSAAIQSIALWLIACLSFTSFLKGFKCDLLDQVINKQNVAASILLGFAWVSIALCIHG